MMNKRLRRPPGQGSVSAEPGRAGAISRGLGRETLEGA